MLSTASQSIDVSASGDDGDDDEGGVTFVLSGFLGGFATQNDRATLTATFKDGGGGTLAIASIGPVTNVDRGNVTGLLFRTTSGSVPPPHQARIRAMYRSVPPE